MKSFLPYFVVPYFIKIHLGQNINGLLSWFVWVFFILCSVVSFLFFLSLALTDIRFIKHTLNCTATDTAFYCLSSAKKSEIETPSSIHTQSTSDIEEILSSSKLDVPCRCNNIITTKSVLANALIHLFTWKTLQCSFAKATILLRFTLEIISVRFADSIHIRFFFFFFASNLLFFLFHVSSTILSSRCAHHSSEKKKNVVSMLLFESLTLS